MAKCPAIFLDSDGLIIENEEYIYKLWDVMFDSHTFSTAQWLQEYFSTFSFTNPPGASKGLTSENGLKYVNTSIPEIFKANSITVYDTLHYSHENGESGGSKKTDPYFIHRAACLNHLDLSESVIINKKASDARGRTNASSASGGLFAVYPREGIVTDSIKTCVVLRLF